MSSPRESSVQRRKRVALLIESSRAYGRECLLGVAAYLRSHPDWDVTHYERGQTEAIPTALQQWRGEGVIARIENEEVAKLVANFGVPVVDLRGAYRPEGGAMLDTDHPSTARLAADHLLDVGFTRFAYCGYPGVEFSDTREQAFRDYLARHNYSVNSFGRDAESAEKPASTRAEAIKLECQGESEGEEISRWLRTLHGPVAVWACNDVRGRQVVNACAAIGLAVPEQVAVLGVDNDEVLCGLCAPPLSSVKPDARGIGYKGAAILARMMNGEPAPSETIFIPALEVTPRMSTEATAIDDPAVAAAMQIIRDRACHAVSIEEIASAVNASRSTLERRFRAAFGRSPAAEIERLRMAQAKLLLSETEYKLAQIASAVGYKTVSQFATAFKRHNSLTPTQYREMNRL